MNKLIRVHNFALGVLSLTFSLTAAATHAQQLQQPASVLPWNAGNSDAQASFNLPTINSQDDSPSWLTDAEQIEPRSLSQPLSQPSNLPYVETEQFSDLGHLEAESTPSRQRTSQRKRLLNRQTRQPFSLFRALGIQASRPSDRR